MLLPRPLQSLHLPSRHPPPSLLLLRETLPHPPQVEHLLRPLLESRSLLLRLLRRTRRRRRRKSTTMGPATVRPGKTHWRLGQRSPLSRPWSQACLAQEAEKKKPLLLPHPKSSRVAQGTKSLALSSRDWPGCLGRVAETRRLALPRPLRLALLPVAGRKRHPLGLPPLLQPHLHTSSPLQPLRRRPPEEPRRRRHQQELQVLLQGSPAPPLVGHLLPLQRPPLLRSRRLLLR